MATITPLRGEGRTVGRIAGTWGECLAEFFGTFVLIVLGDGVVAMAVAALPGSGRTAGPTIIFDAAGDWLLITFGWAFAVCMGIYVAGGVSGAHINPAVTVALAVRRKFPWAKVGPYVIAQVVRRVRRGRPAFPHLPPGHQRVQPGGQDPEELGPGAGDVLDLRHVPGQVLRRVDHLAASR